MGEEHGHDVCLNVWLCSYITIDASKIVVQACGEAANYRAPKQVRLEDVAKSFECVLIDILSINLVVKYHHQRSNRLYLKPDNVVKRHFERGIRLATKEHVGVVFCKPQQFLQKLFGRPIIIILFIAFELGIYVILGGLAFGYVRVGLIQPHLSRR